MGKKMAPSISNKSGQRVISRMKWTTKLNCRQVLASLENSPSQ